ncbi:MAG: hypothetical protein LBU17_02885 [Treponema sp.]|jgi:hypothetical protein|nr:hypothetical protein [Treponema sp.]
MFKRVGLIVIAGFLFFSCATNPDVYREVDAGVGEGSFEQAVVVIEKQQETRKPIYPKKNAVMLYLDKGVIEHYAGQYDDSSQDLEEGERLIQEAYTKSIIQEAASYIANDNTRDYGGEDYEDLYINVFNALNYYHQGDLEGALVEIRKVNEKLQGLSDKYEAARAKAQSARQVDTGEVPSGKVNFSNSALARYLGVLFYRGNGDADDARIDFAEIQKAYNEAPSVYTNPLPRSLVPQGEEGYETGEELAIPPGKARLNVISFAGLSPVKQELAIQIPLPGLPFPNNLAKLALPQMVSRPSMVERVVVRIDGGEQFELDLLEDMGSVAFETFKAKYSLIFLKTFLRTFIKAIGSSVATNAAEEQGGSGMGLLVGILSKVASDVSEQADIRMSRYFPQYAFVGGINLDPGTYSFTVNYYGNGGIVASYRYDQVKVEANKLNLTETVCLK